MALFGPPHITIYKDVQAHRPMAHDNGVRTHVGVFALTVAQHRNTGCLSRDMVRGYASG